MGAGGKTEAALIGFNRRGKTNTFERYHPPPVPPTNQVDRRSEAQAPASRGPPPIIKSKSDLEMPKVTLVRGPWLLDRGP